MRTRLTGGKTLFLAGVAAVAILAVTPRSGWLVRLQLRELSRTLANHLSGSPDDAIATRRGLDIAARSPNDFELQVAASLARAAAAETEGHNPVARKTPGPDGLIDARSRALASLLPRFGDRPELDAHVLRYLNYDDVRIDRPQDEDVLLSPKQHKAASVAIRATSVSGYPQRSTREALALAERCALRGEAVDPSNAYFPTLLSLAYFADNRDLEALAALDRAAKKTDWNDYSNQEARANTALMIATDGGEVGGFARATNLGVVLLPHLSGIRTMVRVATALAVRRELAGDRESGLRIRESIGRIGALMRTDSQASISSCVGAAIVQDSALRPGGAVIDDEESEENVGAATTDARYVAYLSAIGHPDEASWFVAESSADERMGLIVRAAENDPYGNMQSAFVLAIWWGACLFLLLSFLVTIGYGGIAVLLEQSGKIRQGLPLDPGGKWGVLFVFANAAVFAASALSGDGKLDFLLSRLESFELLLLAIALLAMKRRTSWKGFASRINAFVATILGLGSALLAAVFIGYGLSTPMRLLGARADVLPTLSGTWIEISPGWLLGVVVLIVPTILVICLAIRSRVKRLPIAAGIVRWFRASAVPVCGTLLILYAMALGATLFQEEVVRAQTDAQSISEGKADARILGTDWPGLVDSVSPRK